MLHGDKVRFQLKIPQHWLAINTSASPVDRTQLLARLLLTQYGQKNMANSKVHLKPGQNHQPPKAMRKQPRPAVGRNKPELQVL